jgi:uncharacterized metal-binding protein
MHARRVATAATVAWSGVLAWSYPYALLTAGIPVGSWIGCVFTPDRDYHERLTEEELNAIRRWGWLGHFTIWYLNPYGYRMEHRHWLSHAPVISTLGRLLYLLCPPAFCLLVDRSRKGRRVSILEQLHTLKVTILWLGIVAFFWFSITWPDEWPMLLPPLGVWLAGIFVGWLLQDLVHLHDDNWSWRR